MAHVYFIDEVDFENTLEDYSFHEREARCRKEYTALVHCSYNIGTVWSDGSPEKVQFCTGYEKNLATVLRDVMIPGVRTQKVCFLLQF